MIVSRMYGIESAYNNEENFLAGVECEIESVKHSEGHGTNFAMTEDNSLRNHGHEFISKPMGIATLKASFYRLHKGLSYFNSEEAFSPRTSTHVHVNCLNLDEAVVKQMVLLYALFEEPFFAAVKPNRRQNIHCVALSETTLPSKYGSSLNFLVQHWSKYTALNLMPLAKQGTVEFRHLHGTDDLEEFSQWLTAISNLWSISKQLPLNKEVLTDKQQIELLFDKIFLGNTKVYPLKPALHDMIKNSLVDVKFAFA